VSAEPAEAAGRIDALEALKRADRILVLDEGRLLGMLGTPAEQQGAHGNLLETHPTLLAPSSVLLSRDEVEAMAAVVRAVEAAVRSDAYRAQALAGLPETAHIDRGALGAFMGFDFHLAPDGPKLIEINTNAGGALLSVYLAEAQRACCDPVEQLVERTDAASLEDVFVAMFRSEWRRERGAEPLSTVAIVDAEPRAQFLYPELQLFERLLERHGIRARVADPGELELRGGRLWLGDLPVNLVYNRLTDFYLTSERNAVLREAHLAGAAVLTPGPRAHALYANKRNLVALSDPDLLRAWGVDPGAVETLAKGVPRTVRVTPDNADALWAERRRLFFKPLAGYGSRGTYRGSKLTRRVWRDIVGASYVAQQLVPPSERHVVVNDERRALKLDVRCYVYAGDIQLLGARMYRGQATNLRTEGGGLAPVFTAR
jgi:hypothetical protein